MFNNLRIIFELTCEAIVAANSFEFERIQDRSSSCAMCSRRSNKLNNSTKFDANSFNKSGGLL